MIHYIDRQTGQVKEEGVYGERTLKFLYGEGVFSKIFGAPLAHFVARFPLLSALYGFWQKLPWTKRKVLPFIEAFHLDSREFLKPTEAFRSFNDFFCRRLKPGVRPLAKGDDVAVIPADGRYYFYENYEVDRKFAIKGQKLCLMELLGDSSLASPYDGGSLVLGRLCPTDYHRFHFPCACVPGESRLINGWLYSVNPIAFRRNLKILTQNKRAICCLKTEVFRDVLFLEIGATFVGSIHQTYTPHTPYEKGAEKGFFSFGGSAIVLLFPPNVITFDEDLLKATAQNLEIRCLMGQPMGRRLRK